MQTVSANFLPSLTGSFRPESRVDAWYNGSITFAGLPVLSGSVTVDSSRAILGSATIVCGSADASLAPKSWDSPLACYGSELHIRAGLDIPHANPELVSLGWFRIDSYDTAEWWSMRSYLAPRGVQVTVQCSDRMSRVDDARMLAPTAPASLTSTLTEIKNLVRGIAPVANLSGVADAAIPRTIVYGESRVQALQDLAGSLGCVARFNPAGALELVSATPSTTPVWTVTAGTTSGVPVLGWSRKGDRSGLYNAVVSAATAPSGAPLQAVATQTTGPLRFNGPFGEVPYGRGANLATTQAAVQADADTTLTTLAANRTVLVPITVPANPALQTGDTVSVVLPDVTLTGPVVAVTWTLPLSTMTLTVSVPRAALWGGE